MNNNDIKALRKGGINKDNMLSFARCLFAALAISALIFLISYIITDLSDTSYNKIEIRSWEYMWGSSKTELENNSGSWKLCDKLEEVQKSNKGDYLRLRHTITPLEKDETPYTLIYTVKTRNHPLCIKINADVFFDELTNSIVYSGNAIAYFDVYISQSETYFEIFLYAPSSLYINVTAENTAGLDTERASIVDYFGLMASGFFLLSGILLLVLSLTVFYRSNKLVSLVFLSISGIFAASALILNQHGVYIELMSSPITYRLSLASAMIFLAMLQYSSLSELEYLSIYSKITVSVMGVYGIGYILCHNSTLQHLLLGIYALCAIVNAIVYIYVSISKGLPATRYDSIIYVFTLILLFNSIYNFLPDIVNMHISNLRIYYIAVTVCYFVNVYCMLKKHILAINSSMYVIKDENAIWNILLSCIQSKCNTNGSHLTNVSAYVRMMCIKLGMPENTVDMVANATLLHDIGKLALPQSVLLKETQLTASEFEQIRAHVLYGYNILTGFDDELMNTAACIAKQHHERVDGSGYLGLKSNDIHMYSKLVAIADTFDALTSARPYKKVWTLDEAYDYINIHDSDYFDSDYVKIFNYCRREVTAYYNEHKGDI